MSTKGPGVVKAIRPHSKKCFDVHLMIAPADPYLEGFAEAGADIITIHPEAGPHIHKSLQTIRALGKKAGIALNPGTPVEILDHVMDLVDLILVMTVNPGFGGQSFVESGLTKIHELRKMLDSRGCEAELEVDGGVKPANIARIAHAGADVLVAGSAVFGSTDYAATIAEMKRLMQEPRL